MTIIPEAARAAWPWTPRFTQVNGWRMHYVDEGTGPPVLLLHGNPAWGYLYRDVIPPLLAAGRRVVVPDMIGFGLSEKPRSEWAHSLDNHASNLVALIRHLDLRGATFVCHDWGGPTGFAAALTERHRVAAMAIMSTWAWPAPPAAFHAAIFPWRMMHAPLVAPWLLGTHGALAGRGMYLSVVDRARFRDRAQAAYEQALPDPADRLLTWTWPRWIPLDDAARAANRFAWIERELAATRWPTALIWGREDEVFDAATFAARFKAMLPHAEGPHLVTGRHFLQEDSGPEIAALLLDFLARNGV